MEGEEKLEIRYLLPEDDLLEISNIYEESWKFAYKNIIPQEYLDGIPKGRWADNIKRTGTNNNLVVLEDGKLIGTSCFGKSRWEKFSEFGEIISIYFLPEYIGKGYGKLLIEKAVYELNRLGYEKILLWVLEDNIRARNFYERCGFILTDEFRDDSIGGKLLREKMYIYRIK